MGHLPSSRRSVPVSSSIADRDAAALSSLPSSPFLAPATLANHDSREPDVQWVPALLSEFLKPFFVMSLRGIRPPKDGESWLSAETMISGKPATVRLSAALTPYHERVLVALLHLWNARQTSAPVLVTSLREIVDIMGDSPNGFYFTAVRDALLHFGMMKIGMRGALETAQGDEQKHWRTEAILDVQMHDLNDVKQKARATGAALTNTVAITFNPLWLGHAADGHLVWLAPAALNTMASAFAAVLYRDLCVRLRGRHAGLLRSAPEQYEEVEWASLLGAHNTGLAAMPTKRRREKLRRGLEELVAKELVAWYELEPSTGRLKIRPAPALYALPLLNGMHAPSTSSTRLLFTHLRRLGIYPADAKKAIAEKPDTVRNVLLYYYWQSATDSRKPIDNPARWVMTAIQRNYETTEPAFEAFIARLHRGLVSAPTSVLALPAPQVAAPHILSDAFVETHGLAALIPQSRDDATVSAYRAQLVIALTQSGDEALAAWVEASRWSLLDGKTRLLIIVPELGQQPVYLMREHLKCLESQLLAIAPQFAVHAPASLVWGDAAQREA
jgi:hypothetical protein